MHLDCYAIVLKLAYDIDDLGIAQIRAVLLEGQTEHRDRAAEDVVAGVDHLLDGALGNELAHAVIDPPAGQDHLGDVADPSALWVR